MNKKYLNHSGFTLIEVLIAITILSFIMITVVSVTDSSIQIKDRVLSEDKETLQIETALSRFEWDFSQIYSPLYYSHEMKKENLQDEESVLAFDNLINSFNSNENFPKPSYDGLPIPKVIFKDKSTFSFFTTSNRRKLKDIKQSHFAWVQYSLETDREVRDEDDSDSPKPRSNKIFVRKFKPNNVFDKESIDWGDIKRQVLLRNVESLKFEFWDKEKKKWQDNIDLIKDGEYLVRGVKVTLVWLTPEETKMKFVRVYRPLFPYFIPEDMYKLEREDTANTTTENNEENEEDNEKE